MEMKTGKYKSLHIVRNKDVRGRTIHIVFLKYVPVVQFNPDSINERRLSAIDLVEKGVCTQRVAGDICGFHRNTVYQLARTKRLLGIEAVIQENRGLKSAYKYIGKIRTHIKKLLKKYPDWSDQQIADQAAEDLEMEISRSAIARIRTEKSNNKNAVPTQAEIIAMAQVADAYDKEQFDDRQMLLNFKWDKEIKEKIEECCEEAQLKPEKKSDQRLTERLKEGERFNFCGALAHNLFLQEIGFEDIVSAFPLNPLATYQSRDILLTLFNSINLDIPSVEALKLVNASEFGILLGLNRAPEKETLRDHLVGMAEHNLSADLIDRFAQVLLDRDFIDPEVFFIDGHFLPYYGLNVIAKGYYTVRRLAMRGNELYAITDLQGRPLFFITESNEIDFRPIISRCAAKLIEYGVPRPVLVFDRGGYGIHFFSELDEIADFITWAKYVGDKTLAKIPDESFTVGIYWKDKKYLIAEEIRIASESSQTANKEGRSKPSFMELRMVVLQNVDTGKRIAIYTNNRGKPLYDIAFFILNRWGDSENIFKEMMARFNLNYHPGYDIKELENQPLVDNPDIGLIKKAIRCLNKEVEELEREILITEAKQSRRKDKRRLDKLSRLNAEILEKKKDIVGFESKLNDLDEKVSIIELLNPYFAL